MLFALVLGVFSIVLYVGAATALAPNFDIGPELTNEQAAEVAYRATVDQIRLALIVADLAVILLGNQIATAIGDDPLTPAGLERWTREVTAVYIEGAFIAPAKEPLS